MYTVPWWEALSGLSTVSVHWLRPWIPIITLPGSCLKISLFFRGSVFVKEDRRNRGWDELGGWLGLWNKVGLGGELGLSLEKAMAPHSRPLAWKIPWMAEPGGLQSMGSLGVRHDWATSLSLFTFMHWRRKWQLTPVFMPGESQGQGSLMGCCLWGRTESDTTEAT